MEFSHWTPCVSRPSCRCPTPYTKSAGKF
jgi:hypothetical protein